MAGASAAERAATTTLMASDFLPEDDADTLARRRDPASIFADLVGVDDGVVGWLRDTQSAIEQAKRMGREPLEDVELSFTFVGPPGTGKTTVAKRMGELFEALGILPTSNVELVSASDFSTGFIGQAAGKARQIFERAVGGVLFIDEAYRFLERNGHGYMTEVVDEIVQMLTEDQFHNKMVLVLAGYADLMEDMLAGVNPGLRSRVTQKLHFPPFDADRTSVCLQLKLRSKGFVLSDDAREALPAMVDQLIAAPDWSSGRDVDTWAKRIRRAVARRGDVGSAEDSSTVAISAETLRVSLADFLETKSSSAAVAHPSRSRLPHADAPRPVVALAGPRPQQAPPPPVVTTVEEGADQEAEEEGEPPSSATDEDLCAALQRACVALGYDASHAARQALVSLLTAVDGGAPFPPAILAFVWQETACPDERRIDRVLRPQVGSVRAAAAAAVRQEEERLAELARLAKEERQREEAAEAARQAKLRTMGPCPAGFAWHREGQGWRCNGGSHTLSAAAAVRILGAG